MPRNIDKVELIESLLEHLTQNEQSFIQACDYCLGYEVTKHPYDSDLITILNDDDEPTQPDIISGGLCYA